MVSSKGRLFLVLVLVLIFSGVCKIGLAQENWEMPFTIIGDSTRGNGNAILTGIVINGTSKEPLADAHLSFDFFKFYGRTDQFGRFAIELPTGRYKLVVRYVGMKPAYFRVKVLGSGLLNIAMEEGYELPEVEVSDRPLDSNIKESLAGLSKFTLKEIKTLPAFMGEVDILKSIQTLPGVTSVGEGSSGFNVRGGRSDQNLILLNGAPLFNSSHALGFVSGFNQDVITNFSLYKGNVPANFGGRASSVLEVNTKSGDFEKWQFQGGVGLISSRFLAEGPLVKNKSSILAGIRMSNSDWALRQADNPDVNRSAFNFYDANLTVVNKFNERSLLKLNIYSSNDFFRFSQRFGFEWQNFIANAEWKSRTDKKLSPTLNIAFGQYRSSLIDPSPTNPSQLKNNLIYYQVKETVDYIPNEIHSIKGGFELTAYLPKPEALSGYNGNTAIVEKAVEKNYGIESGIFVNDDYRFSENISISAGLRYSIYSQIGSAKVFNYQENTPKLESTIIDTLHFSNGQSIKTYQGLEPRISGRFNLAESQSVKVSYNRMRQYIHQISNTTAPTPVDI